MARIATKDAFAWERVGLVPGDDTEVRRQVFAGQPIPDHYRVEGDGFREGGPPVVGLGAAPQGYKHQVGDDGQITDEHRASGPATGDFAEEMHMPENDIIGKSRQSSSAAKKSGTSSGASPKSE